MKEQLSSKYKPDIKKLNKIEVCDIKNGKSCYIIGEAGTGKTTMTNKIKALLQPHQLWSV